MPFPVPVSTLALLAVLAVPAIAQQDGKPVRFKNLNATYSIDLPAGFRQLSPNEAVKLGEREETPADLRSTSPRTFYAIGRVDAWLGGKLESPWVYVMEQDSEWHIDGDFETLIRERWRGIGEQSGTRHEVIDVRAAKVGPGNHEVHLARRTSQPADGRSITSLDVYAPSGGRQITMSFCAWSGDFEHWRPEFEKWLGTLAFARKSRGQQELSDRLWTPLITGALVGVVLLILYKHTRRRAR